MKFAADRTVGRLAKWLRVLGYDTVFCDTSDDDEFLALAKQQRVLLSRNRRFAKTHKPHSIVFVKDNDPKMQLRQVLEALDLTPCPSNYFSRCASCNGTLEPMSKQAAFGRVPDYIWDMHERFSKCDMCGKVYWAGTHLVHCREEIQDLIGMQDRAVSSQPSH